MTRPTATATRPRTRPSPATGTAPQPDPSYSGPERRRSPRRPVSAQATLQPASGDASVDRHVMAFDLSLGGVGFRAPHPYKVGAVYRITLTGPMVLNARVRVVSCRRGSNGLYDVGGAFC